jgi:glutamate-1-semialdehyde 2,1-aminomutase
MTTAAASSAAIEGLVNDLLTQSWVMELFTELQERQATSSQLVERLRARDVSNHSFWPFHAPQFPLSVQHAQGSRITDADGHEYLDAHLGFGAQALHGHNPQRVVDFVRERIGTGTGNGYFHPVELNLVELLGEFMPQCEKFAFLNSGTDATAAAIRMARARTGRRMVAKFEGSLHGVHDIAAHNTAFWYHGHPTQPFPEIGPDGVTPQPALAGVQPADPRDLLILPNDAAAATELLYRHRNELACVLAEAVSSSFPFAEHTAPMVKQVAEEARRLRVPVILDEVLTGFRYGPGGAAEHFGIKADLYCYGKVITGLGLPLSAVGGRADLLETVQTTGLALTDIGRKSSVQTTHAGNYLSLCASYATLALLREKGDAYYERTRAKVATIRARLAHLREAHGVPLRLLGFGDFIGSFAFLEQDSYPGYREFTSAVNPIGLFLLTLLLRRRGVYTLSLPMLFTGDAHSDQDIDEICDAVIGSALELKKYDFPFVLPA